MKVSRFTFNMFGVNTYILWDDISRDAVIIDPGMVNDEERLVIDRFVEFNNLKLKHMVSTHMHIDHSFGISYIGQKYGLKLKGNLADQFLAERMKQQALMFGLFIDVKDLIIEENISEGDKFIIGEEEIVVLQVPGHSPGSIVLYALDSGFIISGDVLFQQSIGRTDLPGGDYKQLINAIKNKLLTLPDETIVYPGHGLETTIKNERRDNPYI